MIIDFDDPMVYEEAKSILPDTLIVKTGSNEAHKKHYYYYVAKPKTKKIVDASEKTLVDVLGYTSNGKYSMAVAPGAIHPDTGAPYTIINDTEIPRLTDEE